MIFRLLEAIVSDAFIENNVIKVLLSTSPVVQSALGVQRDGAGNLVKPTVAGFKSDPAKQVNWTAAEEVASGDDKEKLISAFTDARAINEDVFTKIHTNAYDVWSHILSNLGFRQAENPFLQYVVNYKSKFVTDTMRQQLITLNNLYSSGLMDRNELVDTNSIIYNPEIWKLSGPDAASVLDSYYKMKKSTYNKDAAADSSATMNTIKARIAAHPGDKPEVLVVFRTGTNPSTATNMESPLIIKDFYNLYFTGSGSASRTTSAASSRLAPSKKSAIDKAIADGSLKYSDIDEIKIYFDELKALGRIS